MNLKHKTKEGTTILIVEMEDSHLLNTIELFARQIKQFIDILDNPKERKKSEEVLFGKEVMSESEASNKLTSLTDKLVSYVFEAAIRGLDISKTLQAAYGRNTSMNINPKIEF